MTGFTQIIRYSSLVAAPWKNGLGSTREVAIDREEVSSGAFRWRVSVASMDAPSPFSVFPGIDRVLAVLHGGLRLRLPGSGEQHLTPASPPVNFDGEAEMIGHPEGAGVQVVNLMVDRRLFAARLEEWTEAVLNASLRPLAIARGPTLAAHGNLTVTLEAGDALRVNSGSGTAMVFSRPVLGVALEARTNALPI